MVKYLSLPNGATGPPSSYSPSISGLQALYAALASVTQNVAINVAGEGMSKEYPSSNAVASYVLNGGVYVDWCGWPMWYEWNGQWSSGDYARFGRFLTAAGVSDQYITTFIPSRAIVYGIPTLVCPNATYDRLAVSMYKFPAGNSVIVSPGIISDCNAEGNLYYSYAIIGVKAGKGWYFWASNQEIVSNYAYFIMKTLGYQVVQPTPTPAPTPSPVPTPSPTPTCQAGYYWNGSECVPETTKPVTTVQTVNWPLVIGIGVGGIGVIGLLVALIAE